MRVWRTALSGARTMSKNQSSVRPYVRRGWFYVSEAHSDLPNGQRVTYCKRMGFITYWLVRWYHGEFKMWEMSAQAALEQEMSR